MNLLCDSRTLFWSTMAYMRVVSIFWWPSILDVFHDCGDPMPFREFLRAESLITWKGLAG